MKWVTREHPKTDRIACPWLIKNFIDADAEFLYVPADDVLAVADREGAHSYDAKGARYTHRDGLCSFEVLVEEYADQRPRGAPAGADRARRRRRRRIATRRRSRRACRRSPRGSTTSSRTTITASSSWSGRCTTRCMSGASARLRPSRPDPRRPPDHHRPGAARLRLRRRQRPDRRQPRPVATVRHAGRCGLRSHPARCGVRLRRAGPLRRPDRPAHRLPRPAGRDGSRRGPCSRSPRACRCSCWPR